MRRERRVVHGQGRDAEQGRGFAQIDKFRSNIPVAIQSQGRIFLRFECEVSQQAGPLFGDVVYDLHRRHCALVSTWHRGKHGASRRKLRCR